MLIIEVLFPGLLRYKVDFVALDDSSRAVNSDDDGADNGIHIHCFSDFEYRFNNAPFYK